ncbi:MAG: nucleotidyl transferase AbiEii/AbiGii toxin family protein [Acidobacteriota bacterium]|nr:nucleotidyl transferase AbiEii/AbiGii toxin family protein [Acidobacteriota bacterium]
MRRLAAALGHIRSELDRLQLSWALVGGLAIAAYIDPRTTRDVDVVIAIDGDAQAEDLARTLEARGYQFKEDGVLEHRDTGRMMALRLIAPGRLGDLVLVDLMFASSGIEPEIAGSAEAMEIFPGIPVPVARKGHLIALKVLASRPQDEVDAKALLATVTASDLDLARRSLVLIDRRGYHRDKDLSGLLETWFAEVRRD